MDQECDILGTEGNIIGTADLLQHASRSAAGDKPPLEAQAPFGVQDNGDITNATGSVVGRLAEGRPQDLVGTAITAIDARGNMKAESGSTIGKAELQDKLLNETISQTPDGAINEAELSDKADSAIELQEHERTNTEVAMNQKPIFNADPEDEDLKPDESTSKVSGSKALDTSKAAGVSEAAKDLIQTLTVLLLRQKSYRSLKGWMSRTQSQLTTTSSSRKHHTFQTSRSSKT